MRKVTLLFVLPALAPVLSAQAPAPQSRPDFVESSPAAPSVHPLITYGLAAEKGDGRNQSYADARHFYQQAAQQGIAEGHLYLGRLHLEGWGVPRDPALALSHIEAAANAGLRSAQLMLSDMYLTGIGTRRDPLVALRWAEKAASTDDPAAEVKLGKLIESGRALPPDVRLARQWYELSAEQDYSKAMTAMAQSFLRPGASDTDREIAAKWLELAVESGNGAAAYVLAVLCVARASDDPAALERAKQLLLQAEASRTPMASFDASSVLKKHKEGATLLDAFRYVLGTSRQKRSADVHAANRTRWETATSVPPRVRDRPRLDIPDSVKLQQLKGKVSLQFIVTKAGFVEDIQVISSDHPALAELAVAGVQNTRYLPALRNGERVDQKVRQSFNLAYNQPDFDTSSLPAALPEEMTSRLAPIPVPFTP
jgi:TonB family protein